MNLIDIWGHLKSFLSEDLKVRSSDQKSEKGYRRLIMRSAHSITSCDQKTINVPQIINVKIITSESLTQNHSSKNNLSSGITRVGTEKIQFREIFR